MKRTPGPAQLRWDACAWLAHWLPRLTRRLRHDGSLRYLWALLSDHA